ncbi:MAG: hypothetical protein Q7S92_02845 [Candidatus Diapherotrites archaeon]|nr:hypothetical protein [Candidatus Diapherotrites archaeon]
MNTVRKLINQGKQRFHKIKETGKTRIKTALVNRRERIQYKSVKDLFDYVLREKPKPISLILAFGRMNEEIKRRRPGETECARLQYQANKWSKHKIPRVARAAQELLETLRNIKQ